MFILPLQSDTGWHVLTFRKITPNVVNFGAEGLKVAVKSSASPIIYKLPSVTEVETIRVQGRIKGGLKIDLSKIKQGDKGHDDFVMRVGLVVPGEKKLNFFQRQIAPKWVLQLHALAPKNSGVDRIEFFNMYSDDRLKGQSRKHPLSDLLFENFVWSSPSSTKDFDVQYTLPKKLQAAAVWLSIDGDDTQSDYSIEITSLQLN
jgi:hypothetical protein